MPDITTLLSERESEQIEAYAEALQTTKEEALKQLALDNLQRRLRTPRKRAEVRPFKLPKRD